MENNNKNWHDAGLVLMAGAENMNARKICPQICYDDLEYMTCPSTGYQKLTPSCSCCMAPSPGCTLYFTNGKAPMLCN